MSGGKNKQNNPTYQGEQYLRRVSTALLKKIGVLGKYDSALPHGCGLTIYCGEAYFVGEGSLTRTWTCYSQDRKEQLTIHFVISQSQLTQAYSVYLTAWAVDALVSFLSDNARTLEDFAGDFHLTTVLGRPLDEQEAAEEIYREMVFSLVEECGALACVPFEVLDKLSLTKYEGAESKGRIAIAFCTKKQQLRQQCAWVLKAAAPVDEEHVRQLRKLVAGVARGCALAFLANPQTHAATCVGVIPEKAANGLCPVIVELDGPMKWKFRYQGTVLFQRVHNGYQIDQSDNQKELQRAIEKTFGIDNFTSSPLKRTLDRIKSKHGAAVIIADFKGGKSSNTVSRIEQLLKHRKAMAVNFNQAACQAYNGCEKNNPDAAVELISSAAAMDGAVVVDLQGRIRYVAVILDGLSCTKGDLARGARFNSVNNFVADLSNTDQVLGVVLSEDGGADIIRARKKA